MKTKRDHNFKIGETVVYPKHGVGEIINIESMEISSIKTNFYVGKMEQAKLIMRVPLDKQDEVCLRKISTKKKIPPEDANEWENKENKFELYFDEKPGKKK